MAMRAYSFEEIADGLASLGIVLPEQSIAKAQQFYEPIPDFIDISDEDENALKISCLLGSTGAGTFDENENWTPDSDVVFFMENEVFCVSLDQTYTHLLEGFAAIGQGDLQFTDIQETRNDETGFNTITFSLNGTACTSCLENPASPSSLERTHGRSISRRKQASF